MDIGIYEGDIINIKHILASLSPTDKDQVIETYRKRSEKEAITCPFVLKSYSYVPAKYVMFILLMAEAKHVKWQDRMIVIKLRYPGKMKSIQSLKRSFTRILRGKKDLSPI